jgi:hypothetical protein
MNKTAPAMSAQGTRRKRRISSVRSRNHSFLGTVNATGDVHRLDIKGFCASYRVTLDTFTRLTGFSARAVANWVQGRNPSESTGRRLTELKRIFGVLEKLVSRETIGPWLKAPNPAFDGSTPLQVIERGETDRIWRMVYELESGEPG